MTADDFRKTAITIEDSVITYDVRPFGDAQQEAVSAYLGERIFRLSAGWSKAEKPVVLVTDDTFETTPQLDGFMEQLREAGFSVQVKCA